jgi:GNAT superfamily N-acetyltransferase
VIEFLGCSHIHQGHGIGSALLQACCEMVDEEGLEVCVEANGAAKTFYERHGFFVKESVILTDQGFNYEEVFMIRPPRAK